ncbi:diaminopimelate epimerase, partial [Streptomyces sp. SID8455]|nr:diaminopimelate epimerase [Streptomyces sp. SID8455]
AEWFMDYRNADGSIAEMCGNGVRVFAHYLQREGLVEQGGLAVATRGGIKQVHLAKDGDITVSMGRAVLPEESATVAVGERSWPSRN